MLNKLEYNKLIRRYKRKKGIKYMMNKEYNVITEFKNHLSASDIKIYLYKMRVRDLKEKHNENYKIVKELKALNNNKLIVFHEEYIGAYKPIQVWGEEMFIEEKYDVIDVNSKERRVLERLLLEEINFHIDPSRYKCIKNQIYVKEPVYKEKGVSISRYFKFDVNIDKEGRIIVGFDLKHDFEYIHTLDQELEQMTKGDIVKDYFYNNQYEFEVIAPFSISESNTYMGDSIINYYKKKGEEYVIQGLPADMKAVLVKSRGKIFPYIPKRLKRVCRFESLPEGVLKDFNRRIKLKTNEKMAYIIETVIDIVKGTEHMKLKKSNMICHEIGYAVTQYKNPKLLFGNNKEHMYPLYGLESHGVYATGKLKIAYFIDPSILKDKSKVERVKTFSKDLEDFSARMGVQIERIKMNDAVNFSTINIENEDKFNCDLKAIVGNYTHTTIVILEEEHLNRYYNVIKRNFSHYNQTATQCISLDTLNYDECSSKNVLLNILLGIYGKSGIQPWILKEPLHSDCFIGLDVSRENKVNKAGVVQVVGKDGAVLKTKVIAANQSGEKINIETLKEIVFEAVTAYKKKYSTPPKHITFHRDGITREDITILQETMSNLDINFDYVEVTKNINRRIATIDEQKKWQTILGQCFYKDNTAFICTTKPYENIGMAQPLRIKRVVGSLDIKDVVEDVYKLTYMHIGAINKIRLPITTYYADLSSTYGNRDLIPTSIDTNCLYFI